MPGDTLLPSWLPPRKEPYGGQAGLSAAGFCGCRISLQELKEDLHPGETERGHGSAQLTLSHFLLGKVRPRGH